MSSGLDAGLRLVRQNASMFDGVHKHTLLVLYRERIGHISANVSKECLVTGLFQALQVRLSPLLTSLKEVG
jgi:hypothetical protein